MRLLFTILFLVFFISGNATITDSTSTDNSRIFLQPEFMIGKAMPGHSQFPDTRLQTIFSLNVGRTIFDSGRQWAIFYNYPSVGFSLSKTSFGHDDILGNAYSLLPFIELNLGKRITNSFRVKVGLGASYFTKYYHQTENSRNLSIGSTFTWTFQASLNYSVYLSPRFSLQFSGTFLHHSNGHTQMPNLGMNSFLLGTSLKYYIKSRDESFRLPTNKPKIEKSSDYFVTARVGIGYHEFGGPESPTGNVKRMVYSISMGGGILLKQLMKIKAGLTYRTYMQYYNYINQYKPEQYIDSPLMNSSNIFLYAGIELLAGHAGFDLEIGVNLYKPFYEYHSRLYQTDDSETTYWLKNTFAARLGVKFYLKNTSKNPRSNVFLGAYINANYGQADFSQLSLGYVYRINNR